jgi:hypothetical protein
VRQAPDLQMVDELLRLRKRAKVHPKWCTVEVQTTRYLVDTALRGRRVQVLYDVFDKSYVLIEYEGKILQRAYPQKPGVVPPQPPAEKKPPSDVDYLQILRENYQARTAAELGALKMVPPGCGKELTCIELQALLCTCRAASLTEHECQQAAATFRKLRPLQPDPTRTALDSARRQLGTGLHLSVYLEALQSSRIRERKKGQKQP